MQNKLCIIINSEYPTRSGLDSDTNQERMSWAEEVQSDLNTIKTTLADHVPLELNIPVTANAQSIQNMVKNALKGIDRSFDTCHIVINSHGASGHNDLKDEIIRMVVSDMSEKNIQITQLSALICNGMSALSVSEARAKPSMRAYHSSPARGKKASMEILQQKLNNTVTQTVQNFEIRGFDKAYNPTADQDEVSDVLNGTGGIALEVSTSVFIAPDPKSHVQEIFDSIVMIQKYVRVEKPQAPDYNAASNMLGKVIAGMKKNISDYLDGKQPLSPENKPLLTAIIKYQTDRHGAIPSDSQNFNNIYKQWLNEYKIRSSTRIAVHAEHAETILSIKATHSSKAHLQALIDNDESSTDKELGSIKAASSSVASSQTTAEDLFELEDSSKHVGKK